MRRDDRAGQHYSPRYSAADGLRCLKVMASMNRKLRESGVAYPAYGYATDEEVTNGD